MIHKEIDMQTENVSIIDTEYVVTLVEYRSSALKESQLLSNVSTFSPKLAVNKLEFDVIKNWQVCLTIAALIPIAALNSERL